MATVSFTATPREGKGKGAARTLRARGQVPAVIYGHDREPQSLALNARDLDKMLAEGDTILDDPETSVAFVAAPRAVIEETPAAEGALPEAAPEPEVIGKGPAEEGEGEGGEDESK